MKLKTKFKWNETKNDTIERKNKDVLTDASKSENELNSEMKDRSLITGMDMANKKRLFNKKSVTIYQDGKIESTGLVKEEMN